MRRSSSGAGNGPSSLVSASLGRPERGLRVHRSDSPRYAQLTVDRITAAASPLARFPQLGEILPEFPHLRYRHIVVGVYRLIYREDQPNNRVLVMAVVHSSRDLPPILASR